MEVTPLQPGAWLRQPIPLSNLSLCRLSRSPLSEVSASQLLYCKEHQSPSHPKASLPFWSGGADTGPRLGRTTFPLSQNSASYLPAADSTFPSIGSR